MKIRWLFLATALFALGMCTPSRADDYPWKTITIVVSLAPGSGMDAMARLYADRLQQALGKPVIVENKPGAATTIAANHVANSAPDGHTLVVLTAIALSINPTLYKQLNYDPQDFVPVSLYVKSPFVLVVDPKLPVTTLADFAKYARESKPALSYASIGTGSVQHMSMEYAKQHFGFEATHVPYRSTAQSVTDLMGGHVAASFLEAGLSIPLVKEGKLRALAVTSKERFALLPDVPPFAEAAKVSDYEGVSWHMLLAPAKTPQPVIERLQAEMKKIMQDAGIREKILALGYIPNEAMSVDDMRAYIAAERVKWGSMVRQLGLEGSQ
jgi:tripartite-type tricarboxylate transporter receptor subunit TctC